MITRFIANDCYNPAMTYPWWLRFVMLMALPFGPVTSAQTQDSPALIKAEGVIVAYHKQWRHPIIPESNIWFGNTR